MRISEMVLNEESTSRSVLWIKEKKANSYSVLRQTDAMIQ